MAPPPKGSRPAMSKNFRLDPDLLEKVKEAAGPRGVTAAYEEGARLWLKARRRRAQAEARKDPG